MKTEHPAVMLQRLLEEKHNFILDIEAAKARELEQRGLIRDLTTVLEKRNARIIELEAALDDCRKAREPRSAIRPTSLED